MMHHYWPGGDVLARGDFWWMGAGSMFIHVLIWVLVIFLVVKFANRYLDQRDKAQTKDNRALQILQERYARGEIGAEEFQKVKTDLEG